MPAIMIFSTKQYGVHSVLHLNDKMRRKKITKEEQILLMCLKNLFLSFSDWHISLSIILCRSIHTVANGKIFLCYGQVIFHCIYVPQLFYLLVCWWALGLLPYLGYYKKLFSKELFYCSEHRILLSNLCFGFLQIYSQTWDHWVKRQIHF